MTSPDRSREAGWTKALQELDVTPEELPTSLEAVASLHAMTTAEPTLAETRRLISRLVAEMAPRRRSAADRLADVVAVALAQARILTPAFWIASIVVMAVGVTLAALGVGGSKATALYLAGPLMGYIGTSLGFRSSSLRTWELELTGPLGARQLTLARMLVVVGYQAIVGAIVSLPLWLAPLNGTAVLLEWLGPLLLATGLTLVLSLWIRVEFAGLIVYAIWATFTIMVWRFQAPTSTLGASFEEAMAVAGLILLGVAILIAPWQLAQVTRRAARIGGAHA